MARRDRGGAFVLSLDRPGGYRRCDDRDFAAMIGLSVAVGRFVEALFWAIFRVAGAVAGVVILGTIGLVVLVLVGRHLFARRTR